MTPHNPIFQSIFGQQWDNLPSVMRKHYANRPYSTDVVVAEGHMKISVSPLAKLWAPFMRLAAALPPHSKESIPVTVRYESEPSGSAFYLNRLFHFPHRKPYQFRSSMVPFGGDEVIEFMPPGIGWHASYQYNGSKVLLLHRGYKIKLGGRIISVPLELLLGKGYAEEEATGEDTFRMYMEIRHAWLGLVYTYHGDFRITEVNLNA